MKNSFIKTQTLIFTTLAILLSVTALFAIFSNPKPVKADTYTIEASALINTASIKFWPIADIVASISLEYRKVGDTGWKQAQDPIIAVANNLLEQNYMYLDVVDQNQGPMIRRAIGTAFNLDANTRYDLKATLRKSDGSVYDAVTQTVITKPDQVVYGTGSTLTVNTDGSGGAYTSISTALNNAHPGDIVLIKAGTYYQNISLDGNHSGTQNSPVTIMGEAGTILDYSLDGNQCIQSPTNYPINIVSDTHDIIIEGLTVKGLYYKAGCAAQRTKHVQAKGTNINRITLQNNTFSTTSDMTEASAAVVGFMYDGAGGATRIASYAYQDITFQNNTIDMPVTFGGPSVKDSVGLYFAGGKNVIIRNNTVRLGSTYDVFAIREGPHENFDVYGNTISGNPNDDGMEIEGGVIINVKVWNNDFNFSGGQKGTFSIAPVVVGPVYIFKNRVFGALQTLKVAHNGTIDYINAGANLADFGSVFVYNNTFYHASQNPIGADQPSFLRYETNLCHSRIILKNNLIWGRNMSFDVGANTQVSRSLANWGQIDSDYNLWWKGSGTVNNNVGVGFDTHSVFSDPKLVSASWPNPDLNLQSGSPAIDKGLVLANINDGYVGSAPDLGAYEYGQAPAQPIVTLTKSADKASAAPGDTITYTINYQNSVAEAQNAIITDNVPNGTTYVVGSASNSDKFTFNSGIATWNLGNLSTGATGSISFQVKIQ